MFGDNVLKRCYINNIELKTEIGIKGEKHGEQGSAVFDRHTAFTFRGAFG